MAFRVYTKTGDKGTTALIGGTRVSKASDRIEAYGTTDELNSYIGLIKDTVANEQIINELTIIQQQLFVIGAILATTPEKEVKMALPHIKEEDVIVLENQIDYYEHNLEPLQYFVLPGGHVVASYAHLARCVCRRAERLAVGVYEHSNHPEATIVMKYLNRLSDYLFVLARYIVKMNNAKEQFWIPEK